MSTESTQNDAAQLEEQAEQARRLIAEATAAAEAALGEARARFEAERVEAAASGRPFRVEFPLGEAGRVIYLDGDELAEFQARTAEDLPRQQLRAAEWLHGERFARREQRDLFIHGLPEGHPLRAKAEEVEAAVAALGIRRP